MILSLKPTTFYSTGGRLLLRMSRFDYFGC